MEELERWWNRFKVQESSIRKFVADARAEDQLEALDALQDVLEEIRRDLFQETQQLRMSGRAAYWGKPLRGIHPLFRPVVAAMAKCFSRTAFALEWRAAGMRARLSLK